MGDRHRSILWEPDSLGGLQEEGGEEHMGGRVGSGRSLHVAETTWVREAGAVLPEQKVLPGAGRRDSGAFMSLSCSGGGGIRGGTELFGLLWLHTGLCHRGASCWDLQGSHCGQWTYWLPMA